MCSLKFRLLERQILTLGEKWRRPHGLVKRKLVDTYFCQWLESNFFALTSKILTTCFHQTRFTFRVNLQNDRMAV